MHSEQIRVRGRVQGVGFRPTVFRIAAAHGLRGHVLNDGDGVLIHAFGAREALDAFVDALAHQCPPLAKIDAIDRSDGSGEAPEAFTIAPSVRSAPRTAVVADAASCPACVAETFDPFNRRYRYPFTNCTHCGPRLSIVRGLPYDRAQTSMARFDMCRECRTEYEDPSDRRYHAQPNACHACGPKAWLARTDGRVLSTASLTQLDDVDATTTLLQRGEIVAIKGIGGFHLACDATRTDAVVALRARKRRYDKPFALMARSIDVIRGYCTVTDADVALLEDPASPVVVMNQACSGSLPDAVAPGLRTLGFMLPYTPLHHLLLRRMDRPIVLTSGNLGDEPQCTRNDEAVARLADIAPYILLHDRDIEHRVDDSVVRVMSGAPRILRRARGHAPSALDLPPGLERARPAVGMGGELKSTFCLVMDGKAILAQHIGDLENAPTLADYERQLELYARLFGHVPERVVVDAHPDYLSGEVGRKWARAHGAPVSSVHHHHAHVASCMAENAWPLDGGPVVGVALDGLGLGEEGELWGGEFLLADYRSCRRVGTFKPVALLGGSQAMREPWRNTYAHLMAEMGWAEFKMNFDDLELCRFLESKPRAALDTMLRRGDGAPLASSCGRLFDAVAAAIGICRDSASYEGHAAILLEAAVDRETLRAEDDELAYPFQVPRLRTTGLPYVEPLAMWRALLGDLILRTPPGVMAARFHKGLAKAIVHMVDKCTRRDGERAVRQVALSGGVFQNKVLLEEVTQRLQKADFHVLTHRQSPSNDGGLSLGQVIVDAARQIDPFHARQET
ncbi:MAG TPA: carbamoyltransferase HypF [Polyangiaceae bacterium]|jgi:hydrogenase maturation protein HypF